jgi:hypothetical protein
VAKDLEKKYKRGEQEEEEEEEEEEDEEDEEDEEEEEEEDSDPSTGGEGRAMAAAIDDANNLDSATFSTTMSSGTELVMPIVNLITFRIAFFDSEYLEALSDPDLAQPAFLRGLKRLWEGFHTLSIFDAIKVLALLNDAQKKLGRLVTFEIRQLVTSDLRRLKSWVRFNLPGVPDDDPRMLPARGLLNLSDIDFDHLTDPMVDERDGSDTEPPTPNPERSLMRARSGSGEETPGRRRQRTGATLRRAGLLPRFFR